MDKLPSSAFRRYFAKLDAPTIVTMNGHPIGVWSPANVVTPASPDSIVMSEADYKALSAGGPSFNSRPFTPVPKK